MKMSSWPVEGFWNEPIPYGMDVFNGRDLASEGTTPTLKMSSRSFRSGSCRRLTSTQLEEHLVRKRQAEYERLNFWNSNSTYFRAWNVNTSLYSNWTSNEFYNNRTENHKKMEMKKMKEEKLIERRGKLKELLEREESEYEDELKMNRRREDVPLEDFKAANMEILLREEEKRRKERDLKLYHYWRQNQPALREFESKQQYDFVKKSWIHQVLEKKMEREAEERKALEHLENLKKIQEEHAQMEREIERERKKTEEELKQFLEKQIEIIKCKEEQEKILKREETSTLKAQAELEELLEERRKVEERRKRKDLSWFHKRQYLLMLKKRAEEVKENLEADRKFLERIAKDEELLAKEKSERMKKFKRELELAREAFRKQAEVEMLKLKQCEFLFEEEAKRKLEKQEEEWSAEEEARNKLMKDVMKMIQLQIEEKLSRNLKDQEELRKCREEMIRKMEEANEELKAYNEKKRNSLNCWRKDLDHQILEKKMELIRQKKQQEEDKENELRAKREEEEKLFRELSKMNILGHQPKVTGRRRLVPI